MNTEKAIQLGYTHKGYIYGFIKVYVKFNEDLTPDICAVNKFYDIVFDVTEFIDRAVGLSEGFSMDIVHIDEPQPFHLNSVLIWSSIILFLLAFLKFFILPIF